MKSTYTNPVYNHPAPDPFVLKHCGEYWCYFTGIQSDGRCFGILKSSDLIDWIYSGSAMDRLAAGLIPYADTCYWAPEVMYDNGKFHLYYSVGNEENMQIRVALADEPGGPFVDSGCRLTSEIFAIDAHVFTDEDGSQYLFYTRNELTHPRIGTGTVFDRLISPFQLAGKPQPVTLAQYDWQIYDPKRINKGGVCWHTLEGSFVLKHNGKYYQMFSGGNWQNESYGVSYAFTDDLKRGDEWQQAADGITTFPLLRTNAGEGIIGPGHNSVVRGLDNRELFCVYHRWNEQTRERVMAIDRLSWDGDRMIIHGSGSQPQPAPRPPRLQGFAGFETTSGAWTFKDQSACSTRPDSSLRLQMDEQAQLIEVNLRQLDSDSKGLCRFYLADSFVVVGVWIDTAQMRMEMMTNDQVEWIDLPASFLASAFHLLQIDLTPKQLTIHLDWLSWHSPLDIHPRELCVRALKGNIELRGFAIS